MFLHQAGHLDASADIGHQKMRSTRLLQDQMPYDFPNKARLIELLVAIEGSRTSLCYGRLQEEQNVLQSLDAFAELRTIFREMGCEEL